MDGIMPPGPDVYTRRLLNHPDTIAWLCDSLPTPRARRAFLAVLAGLSDSWAAEIDDLLSRIGYAHAPGVGELLACGALSVEHDEEVGCIVVLVGHPSVTPEQRAAEVASWQ